MAQHGYVLDSIQTPTSKLSLWRDKHIVKAIFGFRNQQTNVVLKYFVRVDVSYLFPMLVSPVTEYYDCQP